MKTCLRTSSRLVIALALASARAGMRGQPTSRLRASCRLVTAFAPASPKAGVRGQSLACLRTSSRLVIALALASARAGTRGQPTSCLRTSSCLITARAPASARAVSREDPQAFPDVCGADRRTSLARTRLARALGAGGRIKAVEAPGRRAASPLGWRVAPRPGWAWRALRTWLRAPRLRTRAAMRVRRGWPARRPPSWPPPGRHLRAELHRLRGRETAGCRKVLENQNFKNENIG